MPDKVDIATQKPACRLTPDWFLTVSLTVHHLGIPRYSCGWGSITPGLIKGQALVKSVDREVFVQLVMALAW